MHFGTKSTLKSNRNHTSKQAQNEWMQKVAYTNFQIHSFSGPADLTFLSVSELSRHIIHQKTKVNSLVDGLASSGLFSPTLFKGKVAFGPVFKNMGVLIAVFFFYLSPTAYFTISKNQSFAFALMHGRTKYNLKENCQEE